VFNRKEKQITAGEFVRRLEADPEYMRRKAERDREIEDRVAQSRAEQTELLKDLETVGVKVKSVWDLVNTTAPYREAFPVLLQHLRRPYSPGTREGIARSLAVKAARPVAWRTLVEEYCETDAVNDRVKDGLAVALSGASDSSVIQELIELAKDRRHGESRVLLLSGIRRSRRPEAIDAITQLANDPQLAKEINSWPKSRTRSTARP
jgi:hypothetical protein